MKTIQTLFDEVPYKEPPIRTPLSKLRSALLKDFNESIYKFKIRYNRVFYGKVQSFPKGITKDEWLNMAEKIWREKEDDEVSFMYRGRKQKVKLLDVTKANQ